MIEKIVFFVEYLQDRELTTSAGNLFHFQQPHKDTTTSAGLSESQEGEGTSFAFRKRSWDDYQKINK